MKKYITGIIMAVFALIALLPLRSEAVGKGTAGLQEDGGQVSVSLTLPNAAGEKASSLQFSLKLESENLEAITAGFDFDENLGGKVKEARYHTERGILNVYVAGTDALFSNDSLTIGKVSLAQNGADDLEVKVSFVEDSLKIVQGAKSAGVGLTAEPEAVPVTVAGTGGGTEPDNPGGDEKPKADKTALLEMLELAAGYPESDYTAESYARLKRAVEAGEAVRDREDAAQAEVDQAVAAIQDAIGRLVTNSTNIGTGEEAKEETQAGKNANVKTGDSSPVLMYTVILILCVAVITGVVLISRFKRQK